MKLGTEVPLVSDARHADGGECRMLLDRIAASRTFHRSPRLREVLLYIGEKTLAGQARELSEHLIGVRVFGREVGFNPAEDTIVRSATRQLRHKLAEYFATEGRDESVVLEIPKGGYVAAFLPRQELNVIEPLRISTPLAEAATQRPAWLARILGLALAAIALLGAGFWIGRHGSSAQAASEPDTLFARLSQEHPGPTRFVVTDSVVALLGLVQGPPELHKYIDGSYFK